MSSEIAEKRRGGAAGIALHVQLFRGLGDPSRLSILHALRAGPLSVSEIVAATISVAEARLTALRGAGSVHVLCGSGGRAAMAAHPLSRMGYDTAGSRAALRAGNRRVCASRADRCSRDISRSWTGAGATTERI